MKTALTPPPAAAREHSVRAILSGLPRLTRGNRRRRRSFGALCLALTRSAAWGWVKWSLLLGLALGLFSGVFGGIYLGTVGLDYVGGLICGLSVLGLVSLVKSI